METFTECHFFIDFWYVVYVEGRNILGKIILLHEMIHSLKTEKKPHMNMQLDMSKAFDKIIWNYMQEVLKAFGFH